MQQLNPTPGPSLGRAVSGHSERSARPSAGGARGRQVLFGLAAALCISPWASPPLALTLGMVLALLLEHPWPRAGKQASRILLQGCVVLLGFGMNLGQVLRAGREGMLFAAGTILGTLLLGWSVGRRLRIHPRTSVLISAGTAICGGSAIAAVGSVTGAAEAEMTVAMGTVFLLNAVALYAFPSLGHALHLSGAQFGTWAGVAIHDVSSVVGAASTYGAGALQVAAAVKLSRTLWIIPVALGAAALTQAPRPRSVTGSAVGFDPTGVAGPSRPKLQVPWFIGLFLLAAALRGYLPAVAHVAPLLSRAGAAGLTVALFLIGAGISRRTLRSVGWKPLAQGLLLWLFISLASLLVVLRFVPA